jgi:outer membrane protein
MWLPATSSGGLDNGGAWREDVQRRESAAGAPLRPARTVALGALVALACCVSPKPAAAEPWTLARVLEAVRVQHPSARAAHSSAEAGREAADAAFSALSPRIALEANATRTDDPAILFTQRLRQGRFSDDDFALEQLNDPAARGALDAGLVVDLPLWNGGAEVTAPAVAGHLDRAAAAQEEAGIAATLLRAVETYVEAVRARDALAADSIALAAAAERRRVAAELYRNDLTPEVDTLRAAASWGEARVAALDGVRRASVALARLSLLVGEDVRAEDVAVGEAAGTAEEIGATDAADPIGEIVRTGESDALPDASRRGELRAASAYADRLDVEAERAGYQLLPSLNSRGSVTYYRPWDEGGARRWAVGVALSLPIWDGTRRLSEWRLAQARAAAARAECDVLARDLAAAALDAREAARIAVERTDVARAARAAAEEALRLATQRYHAGLLPMGELLLADSEAARARHRQIDSESEVVLSRYRYLHALGELR